MSCRGPLSIAPNPVTQAVSVSGLTRINERKYLDKVNSGLSVVIMVRTWQLKRCFQTIESGTRQFDAASILAGDILYNR